MNSLNYLPEIEVKIIKSFSKYARSYDRYALLQKSMAERLASYLPQKLPPKILELGCGTGVFTRHLLTMPINELALNDISSVMIETLKSKLIIPKNTQFILGNAERISLGKTNLICANAVFQWFQDTKKALGHLKDSLNDNGTILFSTFGPETLMEFREAANLINPINQYSMKQWKSFFKQAGFKLNSFDMEKRKVFNPNTLNLLKNLQQIGATPIKMFNTGDLRNLIRDYDKYFSTKQGVYSTWELYYFSISH